MTPGKTAGSRQRAAGSTRRLTLDVRRSTLGHPRGRAGTRLSALQGFTLIELLIVISIIGILVSLAQPYYQRAVTAAKEATLKEDLFILRDVIDQYYADNGKYPQALNDLVDKKYIRRIPKDPVTGSAETWALVFFTDEQGQQNGIFDVRSGAEAIALDETRYGDW
jgi:general secretion pathway protein G